ncbi:hypothetical protein S40288_07275 [Stachybotrys chartarum IBT 40288]|nr:hypothetical protein S40288_07275 [Stachybotrys chartarum IBT 40288]
MAVLELIAHLLVETMMPWHWPKFHMMWYLLSSESPALELFFLMLSIQVLYYATCRPEYPTWAVALSWVGVFSPFGDMDDNQYRFLLVLAAPMLHQSTPKLAAMIGRLSSSVFGGRKTEPDRIQQTFDELCELFPCPSNPRQKPVAPKPPTTQLPSPSPSPEPQQQRTIRYIRVPLTRGRATRHRLTTGDRSGNAEYALRRWTLKDTELARSTPLRNGPITHWLEGKPASDSPPEQSTVVTEKPATEQVAKPSSSAAHVGVQAAIGRTCDRGVQVAIRSTCDRGVQVDLMGSEAEVACPPVTPTSVGLTATEDAHERSESVELGVTGTVVAQTSADDDASIDEVILESSPAAASITSEVVVDAVPSVDIDGLSLSELEDGEPQATEESLAPADEGIACVQGQMVEEVGDEIESVADNSSQSDGVGMVRWETDGPLTIGETHASPGPQEPEVVEDAIDQAHVEEEHETVDESESSFEEEPSHSSPQPVAPITGMADLQVHDELDMQYRDPGIATSSNDKVVSGQYLPEALLDLAQDDRSSGVSTGLNPSDDKDFGELVTGFGALSLGELAAADKGDMEGVSIGVQGADACDDPIDVPVPHHVDDSVDAMDVDAHIHESFEAMAIDVVEDVDMNDVSMVAEEPASVVGQVGPSLFLGLPPHTNHSQQKAPEKSIFDLSALNQTTGPPPGTPWNLSRFEWNKKHGGTTPPVSGFGFQKFDNGEPNINFGQSSEGDFQGKHQTQQQWLDPAQTTWRRRIAPKSRVAQQAQGEPSQGMVDPVANPFAPAEVCINPSISCGDFSVANSASQAPVVSAPVLQEPVFAAPVPQEPVLAAPVAQKGVAAAPAAQQDQVPVVGLEEILLVDAIGGFLKEEKAQQSSETGQESVSAPSPAAQTVPGAAGHFETGSAVPTSLGANVGQGTRWEYSFNSPIGTNPGERSSAFDPGAFLNTGDGVNIDGNGTNAPFDPSFEQDMQSVDWDAALAEAQAAYNAEQADGEAAFEADVAAYGDVIDPSVDHDAQIEQMLNDLADGNMVLPPPVPEEMMDPRLFETEPAAEPVQQHPAPLVINGLILPGGNPVQPGRQEANPAPLRMGGLILPGGNPVQPGRAAEAVAAGPSTPKPKPKSKASPLFDPRKRDRRIQSPGLARAANAEQDRLGRSNQGLQRLNDPEGFREATPPSGSAQFVSVAAANRMLASSKEEDSPVRR